MKKQAVLSLSGGMDSTSLLLHLLANDYEVTALSFDYGQKHRIELSCAAYVSEYLKLCNLPVRHQIICIKGLSSLLNSSLVEGGNIVPEGHYAQENMKETVVPNRNKIFSSIVQSVALSIANKTKNTVEVAMGIHAGDHAIYPDCRKEFRDADFTAFEVGNWNSHLVKNTTPYLFLNKYTILQDAVNSCEKLNLDFDNIFSNTNTSYKPVIYANVWYSDYKSASSVERIEAFMMLGRKDPIRYAVTDANGNFVRPARWDEVCQHVNDVISTHKMTEKLVNEILFD